ncbi:MAG: ATP synthase F1 subunit gamma [Clostridiales bacterium]|nr:ATP synthase F1 subunit gamma [Clostridiales bacterium]
MSSARDLKRRIKSVKSSQQITKAMKMVSAAKLRRAQSAVYAVRPYAHKMETIIEHISESGVKHELMQPRKQIHKELYVLIGADRGLCGSFNGNLHRFAEQTLLQAAHPYELIALGRRARDFCQNKGWPLVHASTLIGDNPTFHQACLIAERLRQVYLDGEYDEIFIIYSEFRSAMSYTHRLKRLLPVSVELEEHHEGLFMADYILEPSPAELLAALLPQYLSNSVYSILQEAKASEHGARMTAMSSATDNAAEMIGKLTLSLNRARQAAITTEITEIVSGAAALE